MRVADITKMTKQELIDKCHYDDGLFDQHFKSAETDRKSITRLEGRVSELKKARDRDVLWYKTGMELCLDIIKALAQGENKL